MKATFINASQSRTSIAIWVAMKKSPDKTPIAWLSALLSPDSYAVFEWQAVYEYIWAVTGKLAQGKTVYAAERLQVDPATQAGRLEKNGSDFRMVPFTPAHQMPAGEMMIEISGLVPQDYLAVGVNMRISAGIGQPGNGTSVVQAQPNLTFNWQPVDGYFANFGAIAQSEYDPQTMMRQSSLQLDFAGGSEVAVLLDASNTLTQLGSAKALQMLSSGAFARDSANIAGPCDRHGEDMNPMNQGGH
jgi:hypothetical protein